MHARLSFKTQFKITPQLVLAGRLLRVPRTEVEQLVRDELAENPALERVRPVSPRLNRAGSADPSLDDLSEVLPARQAALAQLAAQVTLMVDPADQETAVSLLYSCDDHGYLKAPSQELAAWLGVPRETVERLVPVLHQLEPPGIGARDARECLLIQCRHLEAGGVDGHLACRILTSAWENFVRQRWEQIAADLCVPYDAVEDACRFIAQNLYPYPLSLVRDTPIEDKSLAFPDLIIRRVENGGNPAFLLELPGAEWLELRIAGSFESAIRAAQRSLSSDERAWMDTYVERARLFVAALAQRWTTLRRIGESLIRHQADYLARGPRYMKPLTRAALATELALHESTVSRAVNGKVVQLPNGRLIQMADLFDSSRAAREAIRELLSMTQQRLSDREIAERLSAEGMVLARRTVAKYRAQLNLPAARARGHSSLHI